MNGRLQVDKLMNLDLKHAYDEMMKMAIKHRDLSFEMLWELASLVMRNTGTVYNTKSGPFIPTLVISAVSTFRPILAAVPIQPIRIWVPHSIPLH